MRGKGTYQNHSSTIIKSFAVIDNSITIIQFEVILLSSQSKGMLSVGLLGTNNASSSLRMAGLKLGLSLQSIEQSDRRASCEVLNSGKISYEDVLNFGKGLDMLVVESGDFDLDALASLQRKGLRIFPSLPILRLVQSAERRTAFLRYYGFPTADTTPSAINGQNSFTPDINHPAYLRQANGDQMTALPSFLNLCNSSEVPSLPEEPVATKSRLHITLLRTKEGHIELYAPATVVMNKRTRLPEMTLTPALECREIVLTATRLSIRLADILEHIGLLSVKFILSDAGELIITDFSPFLQSEHIASFYTHNTSVAEQYLRLILSLPFGDPRDCGPAISLNVYENENINEDLASLQHIQSMNDVQIHWLGCHRRTGHLLGQVVLRDTTLQNAVSRAALIRHYLYSNAGTRTDRREKEFIGEQKR